MSYSPAHVPTTPDLQSTDPEHNAVGWLAALGALHSTTFASIAEAADAYLAFVMRVTGFRSVLIANVNSHTQQTLHLRNNNGCVLDADGSVPLEDTFCQYVRASGMPVVIADAAHDERVNKVATRTDCNIGCYIGVPLIFSDGTIYGTLCALDPQPHTCEQSHVDLLRIVAGHLALLLEREQLAPADHEADLEVALGELDQKIALLKIVAHDIRTPLSSIQGYIDLLQSDLNDPNTDDQQSMLAHMYRSAQFINRLVNDLLDAAAAENHTLTILRDRFDPLQLAQSVISSCQTQATSRGLTLDLRCATALPTLIGDADRLRQILLNYLNNALRYTSRGQVTLHVARVGEQIRFAVQDSGPGIDPAVQASIWQMHTRISTEWHGLGLGLYIVQRLAQAMGGEVGVQSQLGRGSTFWVQLPLEGPPPHKVGVTEDSDKELQHN